jgi:hypothetical protein
MDAVRTPSLARWETLLSPASGFPVRKSGLALHQRLISRFDYYSGFVTTDSRTPQREPELILWMQIESVNGRRPRRLAENWAKLSFVCTLTA